MSRFTTLALLGMIGAVGSSALGDEREGTAPPSASAPTASARPEPLAPPIKYLEAGASLFNKKRYELSAKYLAVAQVYRDRLTENERVVLDVYQEKLDQYHRELPTAAASPPVAEPAQALPVADPNVLAASSSSMSRERLSVGSAPTSLEPRTQPAEPPPSVLGEAATTRRAGPPGAVRGTESWRDSADSKQKARWLLHQAREQIYRRQYEEAKRTITQVRDTNMSWGYFDDTPKKVSETLVKARAKVAAEGNLDSSSAASSADQPRDRRTAKARLRDARAALAGGRIDEAERMTMDLQSWGVRYGLFDDTPEKLAAVLAEARRREAAQESDLMLRSYRGTGPDGPRAPFPTDPDSATVPSR